VILSGKQVLVTGADGFIGSHLAEALLAGGCRVRAFAYYNSFNSWGWLDSLNPEVLASMEVVTGDVRDPQSVREATTGCDVVFHLAALVAIPYSYQSPASYVDTNIGGTLNVLQAARELAVERIVHTSTSETYGTARYVPIDEDHPPQGQSPYAATKIGADQMALAFHRSFGTPVTILRPFNTYGPRQSARAIIPAIITQIAAGRNVVRLGALHPTRDFSYVSDTVAGFIAAAEADAAVGQVINVGSGFEISIGATAELIADIMGRQIELACDAERLRPEASEVERLWASTEKACRLLGWSPVYGGKDGFRRGLEETVAWFTRPENLKFYKSDVYNV
jgi:NAD dependent epimerase/dehydratase